jgi:ribosomal protein S18 acetylase RimI-like enzyme
MTDKSSRDRIAVIPAASSDGARVARILADAFAADQHTVGLLPESDRPARLRRMFELVVNDSFAAGGHVWMAVDSAAGSLLGVAVWDAPGRTAPAARRLLSLSAYLRIFGPRVLDAVRTDRAAGAHRPKVPHWYLKDLGTTPEARGRGVGSALLRHRIADADRTGTGVYLESSSRENVGYYQRFGFIERSLIPAAGTTDLIGMWRPPA